MLGHRELNLEDYTAMVRRRLWLILIPTFVVPVIAYLVSLKIPNQYTSQTLVMVENQKVPENYVKPVVTEDLSYRLGTMQEQILSRTRLQPILEQFHLYDNSDIDTKLAQMRKDIKVRPVLSGMGGQSGGLPGFSISFTYRDAKIAQMVCGQITSMFIEENLHTRQQSAEGTTAFLEKQLQESKKNLDEQDARLAAFKSKYIGQLPDREQANLNMLTGLNTQLDAVTQAIARAQQDKTYTESILSQQLAALEASDQQGSVASPTSLQQKLTEMQAQLLILQAHYTDDYPDVRKAKHDIAQLQEKLRQAEADGSNKPGETERKPSLLEPAHIQQLRVAIRQYEQTIKEKTREQDRLQEQIRIYQGRVQMTPMVEEQYKQLTRDYQTALTFYNDLLAKKTQSAMATDLELRQQGEKFRIMDPPNLPEEPSFPNRRLVVLGGFAGGFGLGLAIAFLMELLDKSLRTEQDVRFYLNLPALAVLPTIGEPPSNGNTHRKLPWITDKLVRGRKRIVGTTG